jgi:hypothetical protein
LPPDPGDKNVGRHIIEPSDATSCRPGVEAIEQSQFLVGFPHRRTHDQEGNLDVCGQIGLNTPADIVFRLDGTAEEEIAAAS